MDDVPRFPDDIAIVTLPPERWRDYREIRLRALRSEPAAFGEPLARAEGHPESLWRERLTGPGQWLRFAERGGHLVGLAGAFQNPDETGVVHVVSVYVAPEARGRGVGRRLIEALADAVRADTGGATTLRLMVNDTNAPAIALYRSLGFQVVGVEKDALRHAGRSYDELVMERPVSAQAERTTSSPS